MPYESAHLTDQDLLLYADRELPPHRHVRVRMHLAECGSCAARMSLVRRTLDTALDFCAAVSTPLPPASAARTRLGAQLTELSRRDTASRFRLAAWATACGAVLVVSMGLVWLLDQRTEPSSGFDQAGVFLLPRPDLTPGIVRPVSVSDICATDRAYRAMIPPSVHARVFDSYGADLHRSREYELDYLITPELGGTEDPRNLWPQPFGGTAWNALVKDELELFFHRQVCEGHLDLAAAQTEIALNWITAYKHHFKTDTPLRDYATSPLTERDVDLLEAELEERGVAEQARGLDGAGLLAMLNDARHDTSGRRLPRHVRE